MLKCTKSRYKISSSQKYYSIQNYRTSSEIQIHSSACPSTWRWMVFVIGLVGGWGARSLCLAFSQPVSHSEVLGGRSVFFIHCSSSSPNVTNTHRYFSPLFSCCSAVSKRRKQLSVNFTVSDCLWLWLTAYRYKARPTAVWDTDWTVCRIFFYLQSVVCLVVASCCGIVSNSSVGFIVSLNSRLPGRAIENETKSVLLVGSWRGRRNWLKKKNWLEDRSIGGWCRRGKSKLVTHHSSRVKRLYRSDIKLIVIMSIAL